MERDSLPEPVLSWMSGDGGGETSGTAADGRSDEKDAGGFPDRTGAEAKFYKAHMMRRTPMVVVTLDGSKSVGWIEWYDRDVLKLHSMTEPNLFFAKSDIKYLYRHEEDPDFDGPIPTPPPITRPWSRRRGRRS